MNSIHKEMISREQVAKDKQPFADVLGTVTAVLGIAFLLLILGGF